MSGQVQHGRFAGKPLPERSFSGDGDGVTITTRPVRISPNCTQPPMTDEEMRNRWRAGDPLAQIANAAKRRNGLTRPEVRAIVMGEDSAISIGEAVNRVMARIEVEP